MCFTFTDTLCLYIYRTSAQELMCTILSSALKSPSIMGKKIVIYLDRNVNSLNYHIFD